MSDLTTTSSRAPAKKRNKRAPAHLELQNKLRLRLLKQIDADFDELYARFKHLLTTETSKDDDPQVRMFSFLWSRIMPEQKEVQEKQQQAPQAPLVLNVVGVSRGTIEAREEAIDVTNRQVLRYAEEESAASNAA